MSDLPKGWRTVKLVDILDEKTMERAIAILHHNTNPSERIAKLKELFRGIKKELEAKEIDPDYLAYALLWKTGGI